MFFYVVAFVVLWMTLQSAPKNELPSHSPSQKMYMQMVDDGADVQTFMEMESVFLQCDTVGCAVGMSTLVKETFPDYDFGYHTGIIKKISHVEQHRVSP